MKLQKIVSFIILISICSVMFLVSTPSNETYLDLTAKSAILIEEKTGKILYAKNEHDVLYPASMTKILTASLALDYLDPGDLVVIGREILLVPPGSSVASHQVGETITVENLIRALIIRSGNETGITIAVEVVKKAQGLYDVNYAEAEAAFTKMMNEKAKSIGALHSNFANPHGFHDDNHYSTAYDMALICQEAMQKPLIRQISAETYFAGNSAGDQASDDMMTVEHEWKTTNLIIVEESEYYYPYATGMKTGFTDQASDTLASSATKDNKNLIAIVFYSPSPGRWLDSVKLFEYGFNFFDYEVVQEADVVLCETEVENVRLGDDNLLEILSNQRYTEFLSKAEVEKLKLEVVFNEELISPPDEEGNIQEARLIAPIEAGQVVGKAVYTIDGEVVYEDEVYAAREILERTPKSDRTYKMAEFKDKLFSLSGLPYWLGLAIIIVLIIFVIILFAKRRRSKSRGYNRLSRRY